MQKMFFWPSLISAGCLDGLYFCLGYTISTPVQSSMDVTRMLSIAGVSLLIAVIASVLGWEATLRSAALTRLLLLKNKDYADAYAISKKRKWRISVAGFIQLFLPTLVIVPTTISTTLLIASLSHLGVNRSIQVAGVLVVGLLGILLVIVASVWSLAFTFIIFPVVCCEDLSAYKSITRTFRLTTRYFWRSGLFAVLLLICLAAICVAALAPFTLAVFFDVRNHNSPILYQLPIYLHIFGVIMVALASLLALSIVPVGGALCYYDLIMRSEGKDMLERVRKLVAQ